MLELHTFKNLNTLNYLKYIDSLSIGITGRAALDKLKESLSIQELLLLSRLSKHHTKSTPNYTVEFQEGHALNSNFYWIATLNSIDNLETRLNKNGVNDYVLKKEKYTDNFKLYRKEEYCAYIRPIKFLTADNKKPDNYERFIKRINKSSTYEKVDLLLKGHPLFNQLDGYGDQFTAAQAEDLNYGYRAYTTYKTLCSTVLQILSPLSNNVKLGQCFDMISVLIGYPNWNTFKASNTYRSIGNGTPAVIMTMEGQPKYEYYQDIYSALANVETLLTKKQAHETQILPAANHISILQTPHYDTEYEYVTPFTKGGVYITSIVPWEDHIGPHS